LVVDSASEDQSGSLLRDELPEGEFMPLCQNLGYAGGNNLAMLYAMNHGASYVLIVNPDVRLASEAVSCYVAIMQNDRSIGALNPVQLCASGARIDDRFFHGVVKPAGYTSVYLHENNCPRLVDADVLLGAALMLPIHTLERVGGFDPLFFAYGEEIDLCRRIRLHGLRLVVTAEAPVLHLRSAEKTGVSDFVLFLRLKGAMLVQLKDPEASFPVSCLRAFSSLALALLGVAVDEYPFKCYRIRRSHIVKTMAWCVWSLRAVARHRAGDREGRMYI